MKNIRLFKLFFIIFIVIAFTFGCGKKANEKLPEANTSKGIIEEKEVGDLIFKKTALVYENGTSKLTSQVTNNSATEIYVGSFDIIFSDNTGKEIVTILGYIGSNLKPGESRTLTSLVDQNLMEASNVNYLLK